MKHANANGRIGVIQSNGQEVVVAVKDNGEFAGVRVTILFANAVGKNPGMSGTNLRFRSGPQTNMEALTVKGGNWKRRTESQGACR